MTNARARRSASQWVLQVAWIVAGTAILAASAQLAIAVPFSPVPVTGQTLGLAIVVALLGKRRATLAAIAYLAEGASGVPVFAQHQGGALWLIGPTAGYLWAFPVAAFIMGAGFEGSLGRSALGRLASYAGAALFVLVIGTLWLSRLVGPSAAVAAGFVPFLTGEFLKGAIAAATAPFVARFART